MQTIAKVIICSTQNGSKALLLKTISKRLIEHGEVKLD